MEAHPIPTARTIITMTPKERKRLEDLEKKVHGMNIVQWGLFAWVSIKAFQNLVNYFG